MKALDNLRGVVEPAVWDADWADAHARLIDLRGQLGAPVWQAALEAVTDADRTIIGQLLNGGADRMSPAADERKHIRARWTASWVTSQSTRTER